MIRIATMRTAVACAAVLAVLTCQVRAEDDRAVARLTTICAQILCDALNNDFEVEIEVERAVRGTHRERITLRGRMFCAPANYYFRSTGGARVVDNERSELPGFQYRFDGTRVQLLWDMNNVVCLKAPEDLFSRAAGMFPMAVPIALTDILRKSLTVLESEDLRVQTRISGEHFEVVAPRIPIRAISGLTVPARFSGNEALRWAWGREDGGRSLTVELVGPGDDTVESYRFRLAPGGGLCRIEHEIAASSGTEPQLLERVDYSPRSDSDEGGAAALVLPERYRLADFRVDASAMTWMNGPSVPSDEDLLGIRSETLVEPESKAPADALREEDSDGVLALVVAMLVGLLGWRLSGRFVSAGRIRLAIGIVLGGIVFAVPRLGGPRAKRPEESGAESAVFGAVTVQPAHIDVGRVPLDGSRRVTFELSNTGPVPLRLRGSSVSCGCQELDWPESPLAAGERRTLTVTVVNGTGAGPRVFDVSLSLQDPAGRTTDVAMTMSAMLVRGTYASPGILVRTLEAGRTESVSIGRVRVLTDDEGPIRIAHVRTSPSWLKATRVKEERGAPVIDVSTDAPPPCGVTIGKVSIGLQNGKQITVDVLLRVTGTWTAAPTSLVLWPRNGARGRQDYRGVVTWTAKTPNASVVSARMISQPPWSDTTVTIVSETRIRTVVGQRAEAISGAESDSNDGFIRVRARLADGTEHDLGVCILTRRFRMEGTKWRLATEGDSASPPPLEASR